MGADKLAKKTPNTCHPNLSARAQKFQIFEKSSLWLSIIRGLNSYNQNKYFDLSDYLLLL